MSEHQASFQEGPWRYRVEEDGTATITDWLGDIYDPHGICVDVPPLLDGHPVAALEPDAFDESRIEGPVDEGWLSAVVVRSEPFSVVRRWCASHDPRLLTWDVLPLTKGEDVRSTVLPDGTVRIDSWWSDARDAVLPARIDGRLVTQIASGALSYLPAHSLVIPAGIVSIGDYALRCSECVEVVLPPTLRRLGAGAFQDCWELRSVAVPEGVEVIEASTFQQCDELESITLPASLRGIEGFAFAYCWNLGELVLPEGLARLESFAFADCSVERLELPASLRDIADSAFMFCDSELVAEKGSYARQWLDAHGRS